MTNKPLTILAISNMRPTQKYYCMDSWLTSCRRYGYEPVIVGKENYGGLGSRPRLIQQAIEEGKIATPHMIFTDCWDLVFAADPAEILAEAQRLYLADTIRGLTPRIVWNAEANCFPEGWQADKHPVVSTPYRYLNSGFGVGETSAFLEACKEMGAKDIPDDHTDENGKRVEPCCQAYWMRAFLYGQVPMALDTNGVLCQTLHGATLDQFEFLPGRAIRNKITGNTPMAFHFNGGGKTGGLMGPIIEHLHLK